MRRLRPLAQILSLLLVTLPEDTESIKDVVLDIEPRVVQLGEQSTLRCSYNLEDAPLYTVKWYRGNREFYRYTPSEHPSTKIFPYDGIHVDLEQSNEHQVVLENVGFNLSGNFTCEVTADGSFLTEIVSKNMLVVVLPKSPPTLYTDKPSYIIGDTLRANCTSSPSRPPARLKFILNNNVMCEECKDRWHKDEMQDLWRSERFLELPLFPSSFNNGRLTLRCEALVADMYLLHTELNLDDIHDPVPARVTSPSCAAYYKSSSVFFSLGLMLYFYSAFT